MARSITILLLATSLAGCAAAPPPTSPLTQKFSELEAEVGSQAETLREIDQRVGETHGRITQQTISVSQILSNQRGHATELVQLTDAQTRLDREQEVLTRRYRALRLLILRSRVEELRAQIQFLRTRKLELETQLHDEQEPPPEGEEDDTRPDQNE